MTTTPQPGWYPDDQNPGATRWWDGVQWTEHRSAQGASPYTITPTADLKAPEGTDWNTVWIWLIIVVPLVPLLALLTIDWGNLFDPNDRTGLSTLRVIFSPGYLFAIFGGWIGYGLCVWFAYRDWKELGSRGVPNPFHWAWTFLSSLIYVIGRSVVVRRRTGTGSAPLWASILSIVLMLVIVVYMIAAMVFGIVDVAQQLGR